MEKLVHIRTEMTPDIVLDKSEAIFTIKGSSRPENPFDEEMMAACEELLNLVEISSEVIAVEI